MNKAAKTLILIATLIGLSGCKVAQEGSSTPIPGNSSQLTGFHKVIHGVSGKAVYTVISFPTQTNVEIRKFYLTDNMSPGTYTIDRASISKSGPNWTLTFSGSDCAPNNSTSSWNVVLDDGDEFDYIDSGAPTVTYRFPSTVYDIPKLDQYNVETYTHYSSYCD